jgi:tRNA (guanine-N7-)-methyltransferase
LGSGDGSFLVNYAACHPDRVLHGVERLLGRLRKIERKVRRRALGNVRVVRIEAGYLLEFLLPAASITALHLYFPDPWPKRRHRHHRLVQPRFADLAAQALVPGGCVYLRTDDADYFAQMMDVFSGHARFVPGETPPELAALCTDFERDFLAQGRATHRAAFTRIQADSV